jgi:hypothetical protein
VQRQGAPVADATVKADDLNCPSAPWIPMGLTDSQGRVADPGLPYSDFQICASGLVNSSVRRRFATVSLNDAVALSAGTPLTISLQGGQPEACP